jgi:alkylation response protein AidB-like acyl-CoA dehydrogenase
VSAVVSLPTRAKRPPCQDTRAADPSEALVRAAREVGEQAFASAANCDADGAFPTGEVRALHEAGLLAGALTVEAAALRDVLQALGSGSLPLGRLFEGHVNAIALVRRYGRHEQFERLAREIRAGDLLGVWNTDDRANPLRLVRRRGRAQLEGRKVLASGAGHIDRPLITATDEKGERLMLIPRIGDQGRANLVRWTAQGMRASATGEFEFTGVPVAPDEIVGADGDYEREPYFAGGAWRFAAVQAGAMQRLLDCLREHLRSTNRGGDPHQAARLGQAAIAVETAALWVERAAAFAEETASSHAPERIVAYVNLMRIAVETAALELMHLVQRSVGLKAFLRPDPIERISRDLATYLRQPNPDRALTIAADWVLKEHAAARELWR